MTIIDIMNGKTMFHITTNTPDPLYPFLGTYEFFVKASSMKSAHNFAETHLGPGVSFSTRKSDGVESNYTHVEIYDAD